MPVRVIDLAIARGTLRGALAVLLLAAGLTVLSARPAAAWNETPGYSISIVEGVTTVPEDSIQHVSGSVVPKAEAILTIVHAGAVVAKDTDPSGNVWMSQVPQVGDTVNLESPVGHIVASVVYDGLPSMDPTVCAGSSNFSGQRTLGMEVQGSYETLVVHPSYVAHRFGGQAQITSLTGMSFAGNFLKPLGLGETVSATETLKTPLQGGLTFSYESETERPVGACPVPPAPAPPPPPPALLGSILKFARVTLSKLLHSGWSDRVTINQPGTVTQDLYLQGGVVPVAATARSHKRHKPPALLLARGSAQAKSAGTVGVSLKLTAQGRRKLSHIHSAKAVLITTLHSSSGAKLNLAPRTVTLHH